MLQQRRQHAPPDRLPAVLGAYAPAQLGAQLGAQGRRDARADLVGRLAQAKPQRCGTRDLAKRCDVAAKDWDAG